MSYEPPVRGFSPNIFYTSADQAVCPQANESEAMLAAFSGNATQYTEFITGCGGQVAEIEIALGKALTGNADPSTVCANRESSSRFPRLSSTAAALPQPHCDDGDCMVTVIACLQPLHTTRASSLVVDAPERDDNDWGV